MIQETIPVGMLQCNCYILGDPESGEAVVIDPGDEIERVQAALERHKLAHATKAAVMMHEEDVPLYQNLAMQAAWLGMRPPKTMEIDQLIREGDRLRWGSLALDVLHTPGHSPGSLSLLATGGEPRLYSGDTLFQRSIGRTDLWGGSYPEILRSIGGKLLILPDPTPVFPGHGPATTIGEERRLNPFLNEL
jgi:hydroxyacylglutathione hydrolase